MLRWIFASFLIILIACQQRQDPLIGKWKVNSKFYYATYQILEDGNQLKGLVISYNDGTSKYHYDKEKPYYIFTGLKKENAQYYVNGVSGATTKNSESKSIEIKRINNDSLEVTTFVMSKPLTEIWTRK